MAPLILNGDYVVINKTSETKNFVSFWNPRKNILDFGYVVAKERQWISMSNLTMTQFQVPNGHFWIERINEPFQESDYTVIYIFYNIKKIDFTWICSWKCYL